MSQFNAHGGGLSSEELAHASAINASRFKAWRSILFALLLTGAVGVVYIYTLTWVWTGGLLISGGWLWNSIKDLKYANSQLAQIEQSHLVSLKAPLPTGMKISLIAVAPLVGLLSIAAIGTYDPNLIYGASSNSSTDFSSTTNDSSTSTTTTDTSSTTTDNSVDTSTTDTGTSYNDYPEIVGTFDPTESEASVWNFEIYSGVEVYVPAICNSLVIEWESQDDAGNTLQIFSTKYDSGTEFELSSNNRLVYGTSSFISEEETWFAPTGVYCE